MGLRGGFGELGMKKGSAEALPFQKAEVRSGLAVAAQHVDQLMLDQLLDVLTGGLQILPGVKVGGMLGKILADGAGHGQTQIGVDIDLAHGAPAA